MPKKRNPKEVPTRQLYGGGGNTADYPAAFPVLFWSYQKSVSGAIEKSVQPAETWQRETLDWEMKTLVFSSVFLVPQYLTRRKYRVEFHCYKPTKKGGFLSQSQ